MLEKTRPVSPLAPGPHLRFEKTGVQVGTRVPLPGGRERWVRYEDGTNQMVNPEFLGLVTRARAGDAAAISQLKGGTIEAFVESFTRRTAWEKVHYKNDPTAAFSFVSVSHPSTEQVKAILMRMGPPGIKIADHLLDFHGSAAGLSFEEISQLIDFINREKILPFKVGLLNDFYLEPLVEAHEREPLYFGNPHQDQDQIFTIEELVDSRKSHVLLWINHKWDLMGYSNNKRERQVFRFQSLMMTPFGGNVVHFRLADGSLLPEAEFAKTILH